MATSSKIHLNPGQQPEVYLPGITQEMADKASELLQENHENHHIFFNQSGFHNHIAHHHLTLFALAASPSILQRQYNHNASYQRNLVPLEKTVVQDLHDPEHFKQYLGKEKYYHDFLAFFQQEIDKKGYQDVVNEYALAGDERADDMLVRLYAGFLHPIIHLGFGVEFEQPAIVAEALAQAAVHDNWMRTLFLESEQAAKTREKGGRPGKTIVQLLEEIRADDTLREAPRWGDGNKVRDGIIKRAGKEMIQYTSQYTVEEQDDMEQKTAEMINAAVYFTGTAQHPPNVVKFDFYYMHCVNCSIFFSSFLQQPWLSAASKRRLLEWKVRTDVAMYASRRSPPLSVSHITEYQSKQNSTWDEIYKRVKEYEDDGHAAKLVRALKNGEKTSSKWEGEEGFKIKGDMWRILGNMAIDSVEAGGAEWVRSAGFEEAWKDIPLREGSRL